MSAPNGYPVGFRAASGPKGRDSLPQSIAKLETTSAIASIDPLSELHRNAGTYPNLDRTSAETCMNRFADHFGMAG